MRPYSREEIRVQLKCTNSLTYQLIETCASFKLFEELSFQINVSQTFFKTSFNPDDLVGAGDQRRDLRGGHEPQDGEGEAKVSPHQAQGDLID